MTSIPKYEIDRKIETATIIARSIYLQFNRYRTQKIKKAVRVEQIPWTIAKCRKRKHRWNGGDFLRRTPWSPLLSLFRNRIDSMNGNEISRQSRWMSEGENGGRYRRRIRQAIVINRRFDRKYHRSSTNCGLV